MRHRRARATAISALFLFAACAGGGGGGQTGAPATGAGGPILGSSPGAVSPGTSPVGGDPNDLLAQIRQRGEIRVSTDPNYAPQSFQKPDGTFEGFDIDVANEIAKRLGVRTKFETPVFDLVVAGGWNRRWDISVGSVTITEERQRVLDFTQAYYYTPAQLAASQRSGITTLEGFAGKRICVGSSTTYQFWLEGTLKLIGSPPPTPPPAGAKASPLDTDQLCAQAIKSGRTEFDGWLSSSTTVDAAIKDGTPLVKVGEPVFYEALAVATDKNGPPHAELQRELDRIVGDMHADGTLSNFSKKWFDGVDFTKTQ